MRPVLKCEHADILVSVSDVLTPFRRLHHWGSTYYSSLVKQSLALVVGWGPDETNILLGPYNFQWKLSKGSGQIILEVLLTPWANSALAWE